MEAEAAAALAEEGEEPSAEDLAAVEDLIHIEDEPLNQPDLEKESELLDKKNPDAWVLMEGRPPHPHALLQEESKVVEEYYYNTETGESSRVGPSRYKTTGPESTQLKEGEPWWVSDKNQSEFDVEYPEKKQCRTFKWHASDVQRIKEYNVNYNGLVNHHGSYKEARHKVDQSVRKQYNQFRTKAEDVAAHEKEKNQQFEMLRISGTTGKPTLNSVVHRTKMEPHFQVNEWHSGEESQALRRSYTHQYFSLSGAGLTEFPPLLCNTLTLQMGNLLALRLSRNKLTHMPGATCKFLVSLKELDLRYNEIEALPRGIRLLTNLVELKMEFNHLRHLPNTMTKLVSLTTLRLTKNWLDVLPDNFGRMPALKVLEMSNNHLRKLPPTFSYLQHIETLNLSNNQLATLAIVKSPAQPELPTQEDLDNWERAVDPTTGGVSYFNKATKEASKTNPFQEYEDMQSDALWTTIEAITRSYSGVDGKRRARKALADDLVASHEPGKAMDAVKKSQRRRALAFLAISEWEPLIDASIGSVFYKNNVTGESCYDLPEELDSFGHIHSVKILRLSHNMLRTLPSSICEMRNLHTLEASNNYINALPEQFGASFGALTSMSLAENEITAIPSGMAGATQLTKLNLTSNFIEEVPHSFCAALVRLQYLMLANNQLTKLPNSFRLLCNLKELQLDDNPLENPPMDVVSKGKKHIFWHTAEAHYRATRGPPPEVHVHRFGTAGELRAPWPLFRTDLLRYYRRAEATQTLDLKWLNLEELPPEISQLSMLTRLRLVGNRFDKVPLSLGGLTALVELKLNCCNIVEIADDVGELTQLKEVSLQDNKIVALPNAFTKLSNIECLNLSNNRLTALPDSIGQMTSLREVHMDVNKITALPRSIGQLKNLEFLTMTNNKLKAIPNSIQHPPKLKQLWLNSNEIIDIPDGIGRCPALRELHVGFNKLTAVNDCLGESQTLTTTLRDLWLFNNQIVQLPHNIVNLQKLDDLRLDNNPLRSPPVDLLPKGLTAIFRYCRIRFARLREIKIRLKSANLMIKEENFTPIAKDVITGKTGYLTPEDLAEADQMVDNYVNYQFYLHAPSGEQIVRWVLGRMEKRLFDFQRLILQKFIELLDDESKMEPPRFSDAVLDPYMVRPWGDRGEDVSCYCVAEHVILNGTSANEFVREDRPSLLSLLYKRLPQNNRFKYDFEAFVAAVRTFVGPFGHVAQYDESLILMDRDERIDPATGFALNAEPCEIRCILITKVIYSAEEAREKRHELDNLVPEMVEDVQTEVSTWLRTRMGKRRLKAEVKRRKKENKLQLVRKAEKAVELQAAVKKIIEGGEAVNKRWRYFTEKHVMPMHHFADKDASENQVEETNKQIMQATTLLRRCEASLAQSVARKKWNVAEWIDYTSKDLENKYVKIRFEALLRAQRLRARKKGMRRPWDGEDGKDFVEWTKQRELLEQQAEDEGVEVPEDKASDGKDKSGDLNFIGCEFDEFL